jgi:iron-sulfur cluster assembly accessory protein
MSTPSPSHRPPTLLWTSDAVEAIRALRVEEGRPGAAFRVDLRLGGCQGFKVYFELDAVNGDDVVFEAAPDVSIAVQQDGLAMLDGGILDYESSHRGRGFRLANPAAKSACGCGQAFYADFSDHEPDAVATAE